MPAEWAEIRRILAEAVDLAPADRGAYLHAACDGRPELRSAVEDLLSGPDDGGLLDPDLGEPAAALLGDAIENPLAPGDVVGRYRVVRVLGRGGMGVVYEARDERLSRDVALKVFSAVQGGSFLSRFAAEPRLLARLQHPGIAQVYEVGVHTIGGAGSRGLAVPYFAMELIENGRPITEYAVEHRLPARARIALLIEACDAVAHGHSRGVIHRDLKPANILVGDSGHAKVIDFGVARAADEQLGFTRRTGIGQIVGTLRYMSPEALSEGGSSADVRSDVYALGLVMYEILSGALPYTIDDSSVVRASRTIQEARRARLSDIDPALSGDIESVALKAVDPGPARRYQSAAELAADLRRYLGHEPVTARPPSAAYQLRLFARRNKTLVGAAIAVVLALVIGIIGTGIGLARATAQARRAQRVARFLEQTFRTADPNRIAPGRAGLFTLEFAPETVWLRTGADWPAASPPGRAPTGIDVLRRAASRLDAEFPDEPLLRADLAFWIGTSLASLGDPSAAAILRTAVEIRRTALGLAHEETLRAVHAYAAAFVDQRAADELLRLLADAQDAAERLFGRFDARTLLFWDQRLAMMNGRPGPPCATADFAREKWEEARRALRPEAYATLRLAMRVALHLNNCNRHEEAESLARQTFAVVEAIHGRDSLPAFILGHELINILAAVPRQPPDLENMMRQSIRLADDLYGQGSSTASARLVLARTLLRRRALAEAEPLAREAVAAMAGSIPSSIQLAKSKGLLARILVWGADPEEADEARRLALQAAAEMLPFTGALGPFEDYALYHAAIAAGARRVGGDPAGAEAELESLRTGAAEARGSVGAWAESYLLMERGQALAAQSRTAEALEALRAAQELAEAGIPDPTHHIRLSIDDALAQLQPGPSQR